ncbi:MAG: FHA domain-containing protein [Candidatus Promineifilaceae bacterium]
MLIHPRTFFKLFLSLLILFLLVSSVFAQEEGTQLRISQIDTADFPQVAVRVSATDVENNPIDALTGLTVSEDQQTISDFDTRQVAVGIDLIFVIDANTAIEQVDEGSTLSRREKVRDSINDYANTIMDVGGQDDIVSIIVPEGESGRFLEQSNMTYSNEVINAINFYETGDLADTPLNAMLEMALDKAEENQDDGRYQVIFLYTDGGQLNTQLDYPALTERAQTDGVSFYGAILGSRADQNEIANVTQLTDPTGGTYVHMPESADADPLFESINEKAVQTEIVYQSTAYHSGSPQVVITLGDASAEVSYDLTVEPAAVAIPLDNSQPIRRVATDADTPLEEMEPTSQPLAAEVTWPDGHPRSLTSATLLVNGTEVPLDAPVLDNNGLLTFEWNISGLDAGDYELQVRIVDELGLESVSDSLPLTIEIDRPDSSEVVGTPVPTQESEAAAETETGESSGSIIDTLQENILLVAVAVGVLILLIIVVVVILVLLRRRRGSGPSESAATAAIPAPIIPPLGTQVEDDSPATTIEQFDSDATFLMQPDFVSKEIGGAYLEPLEYAPEHSGMIPLTGSNVALGRDPNLVQIPFNDRSVSRLHARIMESSGTYRLYDEGSASGTYLNYERIGLTPRTINDKDDLHFGRVHLRFHVAAPKPEQDDPTQILQSSQYGDDEATDTQVYIPSE